MAAVQQLYGCRLQLTNQNQGTWWIARRAISLCLLLATSAAIGCSTYDDTLFDDRVRAMDAARNRGLTDAGAQDAGEVAEVCGDGRVALFETCDIAIASGEPGACPRFCPPIVDCVVRRLEGSNCQAQCVVLAERCEHGDGCCPASCNSTSDHDCSRRCGDGVVQLAEGETCEPESPSAPCWTLRDCDDGDPCTTDVLVGGEANCNAQCSHAAVHSFVSGDGCCPDGADANSDGDCSPVCGNGVVEDEEECDGDGYCDDQCRATVSPEQSACLATLPESSNACDHCSCIQCAEQRLDCVASGNAERDMHCAAIIQCANDNDCIGSACYCADRYCREAGPCRAVIDAAAAANPSPASVGAQSADPETAVGRSRLVGNCKSASCSDTCP